MADKEVLSLFLTMAEIGDAVAMGENVTAYGVLRTFEEPFICLAIRHIWLAVTAESASHFGSNAECSHVRRPAFVFDKQSINCKLPVGNYLLWISLQTGPGIAISEFRKFPAAGGTASDLEFSGTPSLTFFQGRVLAR